MPDHKKNWTLKILETPEEMALAEALQRIVWPNSETDVVPLHMLITVAHNGGLVVGAFAEQPWSDPDPVEAAALQLKGAYLVGFVYGFPGLYFTPDGPRAKHCSHQLAVHPALRSQGIGFALKRAQWQMVRHQGLDRITWTYDPLLSRNAYLNITKLGAVCTTYLRDLYGEMRDGLNAGLPSDRFQVDWWVNTRRVNRRLSRKARPPLNLSHALSAGAQIINPGQVNASGHLMSVQPSLPASTTPDTLSPLVLVEIPSDFQSLRSQDPPLAREWRLHTRAIFETLFQSGYIVTDLIHAGGTSERSYYVLTHGESTL